MSDADEAARDEAASWIASLTKETDRFLRRATRLLSEAIADFELGEGTSQELIERIAKELRAARYTLRAARENGVAPLLKELDARAPKHEDDGAQVALAEPKH